MAAATGQTVPSPVRAIRILLFIAAGLTLMTALDAWLRTGGAYGVGVALAVAVPGIVSLVAGRAVGIRPSWRLWLAILVLEIFYLLWQLSRIGAGDPFGVLGIAFPIAMLILLCRASARRYFR